MTLTRYERDPARPTVGQALRDVGLRAVLPGFLVFGLILAGGLILMGPLAGWNRSESEINRSVQDTRTPMWDSVTAVWSHVGNTEIVIGVCAIVVALTWWRTRQWWYAVVPAIAIALQATIFVIATALVGRPRPSVPHLDPAPPTSSYPSGHVGATTALYVVLALMAQRIEHPVLRRIVTALCLVVPALVAYARLYRGMHHLSDIIIGALNGLACALLAWGYLRRRRATATRTSAVEA